MEGVARVALLGDSNDAHHLHAGMHRRARGSDCRAIATGTHLDCESGLSDTTVSKNHELVDHHLPAHGGKFDHPEVMCGSKKYDLGWSPFRVEAKMVRSSLLVLVPRRPNSVTVRAYACTKAGQRMRAIPDEG